MGAAPFEPLRAAFSRFQPSQATRPEGVAIVKKIPDLGKKELFAYGIGAGLLLAANWRRIAKGGIKAGLRGAVAVQRIAVRTAESVSDVTHEAVTEIAEANTQG